MDKKTSEELGELVLSIAKGNGNAVDKISKILGAVVYKIALFYVRNRVDAEDVVQETWCKIVEKARFYRQNKNAYSWINTIAKNTAIDFVRDAARRNSVIVPEAGYYEIDQNKMIVGEALQILNDKELDLIIFTYWYELSLAEIAKATRIPKSTVKYRLGKVLAKLKDFYEK